MDLSLANSDLINLLVDHGYEKGREDLESTLNEDYKALEKDNKSGLEVMKAYIEEKYPQDSEAKRIYNDLLRSIKINSQVVSWKNISPIK